MRPGQEERSASPLTTLVVAWTVVVGLAFAPVAVYFTQTGNIRLLLAVSAAAFLIGLALFVAMALARVGAHARRRQLKPGEVEAIANLHKRGAIFGKR